MLTYSYNKYGIFESHAVTASSHGVLEMSAIGTNARWKSLTLLLNSRVNNIAATIAPDLNQPLFQLINVLDAGTVNMFLNSDPYLIVTG